MGESPAARLLHPGGLVGAPSLQRRLVVKNNRLAATLATSAGQYKLAHDRFYYFVDGRYSETFAEIEIETIGDPRPSDPQIEKIRRSLTELLGYIPSATSKVRRGMDWTRNRGKDL